MLRRSRRVARSVLALLIVGAIAWPSSASAAPKPRPDQWWFKSWGVQSHLWPLSVGTGVTIALIDTGVQANLPELQGVVLSGIDLENRTVDGRQDLDRFNTPPGHGTAMASLIAAQGGRTGLVGVAPGAKILPIVAQSNDAYAKGIRYAADRGTQVINLSQAIPGPCPRNLQEAIAYALEKDVVIVVGAGNDGDGANSSNAPANCMGVLSVGAVDSKFSPWMKTQRQSYVKVAAPGVDMRVLLKDGELYRGKGTSDAAAVTSAAVALIRAKYPSMTNREVVRQLIASALDVYEKGNDNRTGYGVIRPYRPLAGKAPKGTANPVFDEFDRWKRTHQPEGAKSAAPAASKDDDSSLPSLIVLIAVVVVVGAAASLFGFFFSRRKRGGPPPLGPGTGFGAPQAFGQQPPGGQHGPYPPVPPQGAPPHYQPHPPPGQHPPGQWPPGGAPPARPPQ
ncbi:type VII secretion-associated serine protease mycosin [Actinomadura pelletieri DSM 43383]|uniref:Type VII secretion-associated serine protease mycosin n=1 Tax=Actinomadura pelletieri DSM 43383 TaxID=1120940 RepID=A0A495QH78_9ACTN|nr:type VII secretion-associated serine protease mycosin [Actinomadura pelletieri DSM 43383]